jgi:hypothetical protein
VRGITPLHSPAGRRHRLDFRHKPDVLLTPQGAPIADKGFRMTSPITEEAKTIIDAAPSHGPLRPAHYARALPPRAGALVRVLADEKIVAEAESHRRADISAILWRRIHTTLARSALALAALSVVLGGVRLYVAASPDVASLNLVRAHLGQVQIPIIVAWLVAVTALFSLRPARRWFHNRAAAEHARQRLFELLMFEQSEAEEGESPLLPLQVECFRRHLLETQQAFFERRCEQNRRAVKIGRLCAAVALVLIGIASLPQLHASLSTLGALAWVPEAFRNSASRLLADKQLYALTWLVGISLQVFLTNLAIVSPMARHAESYEMMRRVLRDDRWQLSDVRDAAARGSRDPAEWFGRGVLNILSAETSMWLERVDSAPEWQNRVEVGRVREA